jgi:hypothetical protein
MDLLFTAAGPISIKQAQYTKDFGPPDHECSVLVCKEYSRAYLRHLYRNKEILFSMLASYHNLAFLHEFVHKIRYSIEEGRFTEFKYDFLQKYRPKQECKQMKKFLSVWLFVLMVGMLILVPAYSQDQDEDHKKRLDVLRYGIESQVMN